VSVVLANHLVEIKSKGKTDLHETKACGETEVLLHQFLTSTLGVEEWFTSLPGLFTPVLVEYGAGWTQEPL
jgi:hypothetical protein